jgi:hypothetical protein
MKRTARAQSAVARGTANKDTVSTAAASVVAWEQEGSGREAWRVGLRSARPACQRRSSYPIHGSGLVFIVNPALAPLVQICTILVPFHGICWPDLLPHID